MDIRKPKPIHSWRELLSEIGVIVIGITIALTGEQIIEASRWRSEVAEVKETLNTEVREHLSEASEREALGPCEARQLRAVETIVRQPGVLPPHLPSVAIALRPWTTNGWEIAATSGVLPHMTLQDRTDYSDHFDIVKLIGAYNSQEFLTLADLRTLRPSTVISEVERDRILSDIAKAQQLNAVIQIASRQLLAMPIRSSPQALSRSELAALALKRSACSAQSPSAASPSA